MKIIQSFGNSVGINSQAQKANTSGAKNNLETNDAKKILTNTLAISAAAFFGWLAVDKIKAARAVEKGIKPIIAAISEECTEPFQKAIKNFNDWQKLDFIKAFNAGAENASDKTRWALENIVTMVNDVMGKEILPKADIPENSIEGFEKLFSAWIKK